MTGHVIVTDADRIRIIRMNRPNKKNALTLAMYEAMAVALEGANASDAVPERMRVFRRRSSVSAWCRKPPRASWRHY
jgi:enoyl-CoA hydratase/carnithine racemase